MFHGTLEEAGFPDNHFGVVTLWDVVEHLDEPASVLREVSRVLRPGGTVVVFTINQRSLINTTGHVVYKASFGRIRRPLELLYDVHHNYFFSPATLTAVLRR